MPCSSLHLESEGVRVERARLRDVGGGEAAEGLAVAEHGA